MAESDWQELANSLNDSSVARGATGGIAAPNGGGSFIFGMNSKITVAGAVGLHVDLADFNPMAKGGEISVALQRGGGGGDDDHAAFMFLCLGGDDVSDEGYLLGLGDADEAHIVLRKGTVATGLPDEAPGTGGVLARSAATYGTGEWVHLKLEVVVNPSGDVVLNVYENDLDSNTVASPDWTSVTGMKNYQGGVEATAFLDDALGINSTTAPLTSGYGGLAGRFDAITRRCYFDHIVLARQT